MKKGRTLELVAFSLERALSGRPGVKVHSPYKALDRTTGKRREHDVAIVHQDSHHEFIIALECRDRSRPVTVPQVEGFSKKCQETGVHRGGIVSSKGFCKTANEKAKALQIECLGIEQVEDFNWFQCGGLTILKPRIVKQNWVFIPEVDIIPKPIEFSILDAQGNEVTPAMLKTNVIQALEGVPNLKSTPGAHPVKIRFDMRDCSLLDKATGTRDTS